jgi:tetratricopeptide (TPR) repeat protein
VYLEVLPKVRELGMDVGVPLRNLADVARKQGRFSDAEALYEEAIATDESVGDESSVAFVCIELAEVHVDQGRFDMARVRLRRALSLLVPLRSPGGIGWVLEVAAVTATDARSAARLLEKSRELREGLPHLEEGFSVQATAAAVDALGQERFDAASAAGRALSLDDAVALALEVIDA